MKSWRFLASVLLLTSWACPALADETHVKWAAKLEPSDARSGESAQVVITAKLDPTWHLYSLTSPEGGPVKTTISLKPGPALREDGKPVQPPFSKKHEEVFNLDIETYAGEVAFGVPVKIGTNLTGPQNGAVSVKYQVCDPHICLPPVTLELPVEFTPGSGPARPDHLAAMTNVPTQPAGYEKPTNNPGPPDIKSGASGTSGTATGAKSPSGTEQQIIDARNRGLLSFVWLSLVAGFAALLTPCVFPMIPITVSFFTKKKDQPGGSGIAGPLAYCLGIIGTFTGLGMVMALVFGASSITRFATNPYVNLALATLFIVLAANLFGVFEIVIPSWLVNKAYAGTSKGGLIGPLLMGFTFTLTSFTCTVPFVGTILVTASQGSVLYPLLGMIAFSTAFALPFFFLAMFPQYLSKLPKSGSWLVSVKATMGFLELAAALKFISNADLVWTLGLITRPVFLGIWSTIGVIGGLYLLGWLKLPHDEGKLKLGWIRRGLGVAFAAAGIYCLAAMQGASLGQLEAFPPPDPYPGRHAANAKIQWLSSYDEALAVAKLEKKALFINFTGAT